MLQMDNLLFSIGWHLDSQVVQFCTFDIAAFITTLCLKKVYPSMFDNNWQMWTDFQTDFQTSVTSWFMRKFSMYRPTLQRFPPHLQCVAALRCEIQKSKKCYRIFTLNVKISTIIGLSVTK